MKNLIYIILFILNAGFLSANQDNKTFLKELTKDERQWLEQHPAIKVHNEKNWPPFNFNDRGTPKGFSIEYMNLLAQKTGLHIEYVTGEWNDLYNKAINKKLDVMLNIAKSKEREKFLLFTQKYHNNNSSIYIYP